MNSYYTQLTKTDDKLREISDSPDSVTIQDCIGSLQAATKEYCRQRQAAFKALVSHHEGRTEFSQLLTDMRQAMEQETAVIRTARQDSRQRLWPDRSPGGLPAASARRTSWRWPITASATRWTRPSPASLAIRSKGAWPPRRPRRSSAAKAASSWPWPGGGRTIRTTRGNSSSPCSTWTSSARSTSSTVPRRATSFCKPQNSFFRGSRGETARWSGFRARDFLFLFPDADVHYAAGVAERIRQMIEATPIDYHKRRIRLTISCAVVAAAAQETPASLCDRADAALSDAKRYGRNKTFSYDGDYAAPVAAPNLTLAATPVEAG